MKPTILIGILLILGGIFTFAYQGITFTKPEKVAQLGDVKIVTDKDKTINFPPLLGGGLLAAGVLLLALGSTRKQS